LVVGKANKLEQIFAVYIELVFSIFEEEAYSIWNNKENRKF
jgi:hypothetical protein